MKGIKTTSSLLIVFSIAFFSTLASAQEFWPGLEKGEYDVGYSREQVYDASRNFRIDEKSPVIQRPMQISIWFPAVKGELDSYRQFQEYYFDLINSFDFKVSGLVARQAALKEYLDYIVKNKGDLEKAKKMFARLAPAITDADHAPGKFPLVIYAPGRNSPAIDNSHLCEYLASHGFVVAAVSSQGKNSPDVTGDKEGFEALIQDIAFVREHASLKKFVDKKIVAIIGHSFGGMSATLYALKNPVSAIVNLDGSNFAPGWQGLFNSLSADKGENLKGAYLHFMSDPPADSGFDHKTSFFQKLQCPAILAKIKGFGHEDYLGMIARFYLHTGMVPSMFPKEDMSFVEEGYGDLCHAIRIFLELHLKNKPDSGNFLQKTNKETSEVKDGDLLILEAK